MSHLILGVRDVASGYDQVSDYIGTVLLVHHPLYRKLRTHLSSSLQFSRITQQRFNCSHFQVGSCCVSFLISVLAV